MVNYNVPQDILNNPRLAQALGGFFHDATNWNGVLGQTDTPPEQNSPEMTQAIGLALESTYARFNASGAASRMDFAQYALGDTVDQTGDPKLTNGFLSHNLEALKGVATNAKVLYADYEEVRDPATSTNARPDAEEPAAQAQGAPTVDRTQETEGSGANTELDEDRPRPQFTIFEPFEDVAKDEISKGLAGAYKNPQGISPGTLRIISQVMGGVLLSPAFIQALEAQAASAGMPLEQWLLESQSPEGHAKITAVLKQSTKLFQTEDESPHGFKAVKMKGISTDPLREDGANIVFVDQRNNEYSYGGGESRMRMAPGTTYDAVAALNFMRGHVAKHQNPPADGSPQELPITITPHGLSGPDRQSKNRSMTIIAAIHEARQSGIIPKMSYQTYMGGKVVPLPTSADIKKILHKDTHALMQGQNIDVEELLKWYDNPAQEGMSARSTVEAAPAAVDPAAQPTPAEPAATARQPQSSNLLMAGAAGDPPASNGRGIIVLNGNDASGSGASVSERAEPDDTGPRALPAAKPVLALTDQRKGRGGPAAPAM